MDQYKYSTYVQSYNYWDEPNSLMSYNGSASLGAMSSKEAFERVVTSPQFLMWEFEMQEKFLKSR